MPGSPNLGALTTTFSAPPSCESDDGTYKVSDGRENGKYYYVQGPRDTTNCMPRSYVPDRTAFYSPAPNCPAGFTPACSETNTAGTVTETVYTCCPTQKSYSCLASSEIHSVYTWQSTLGCAFSFTGNWSATVTIIDAQGSTTIDTSLRDNGGAIGAYSVQVRFQESDLTTTASSSSSSISPINAQTAPTGSAPSETPSAPASSSGGLSSGAAAGIGVGCAVAAIGLAAVAIFLFLRKRKRRLAEAQPLTGPAVNEVKGDTAWPSEMEVPHQVAEVSGYSKGYEFFPVEIDGSGPSR
ncbi:hypothetical protein GGS26DRAFT_69103 [Hypomontagnella submonticulosa]|nr:hypothetical protein GGS26DRAFT_69103 [Hypomontagnella submonticulosa]